MVGEFLRIRHRLDIRVLLVSKEEFLASVAANPFPEAGKEADGKALHLLFLETAPASIDSNRLDALGTASESWRLVGRVFYLHAPDGFHGSKLAARVEPILGVPATARNWRTVSGIGAIARRFL